TRDRPGGRYLGTPEIRGLSRPVRAVNLSSPPEQKIGEHSNSTICQRCHYPHDLLSSLFLNAFHAARCVACRAFAPTRCRSRSSGSAPFNGRTSQSQSHSESVSRNPRFLPTQALRRCEPCGKTSRRPVPPMRDLAPNQSIAPPPVHTPVPRRRRFQR